ncbi:acyltransferase [Paenibacillus sp. PastF-3]|uniref:acyltransferase n=1 Tax=Paenibacillus sp. PastF-3 TaxID=2940626 RepID=UPI002474A94F|nr:acyltransferase [Paenibacillus sp. PastF-3]
MKKIPIRIKIILWDLFVNIIFASPLIPREVRVVFYRLFGMKIKTRAINPKNYIIGKKLSIGKGTFVNYSCFFDCTSLIEIGERCNIAMGTMFVTASHQIGNIERRAGLDISKPIKIGNGCWIGARSTILPGVTIGEGCIIAAGSLVIKNCSPNSLYAGVPAKRIKEL